MTERLFDLTGKVALVTGGSRGIGRSIALALGAHGAQVAVNYASNESAADTVVAELGGADRAIKLQGDISDVTSGPALVEETVKAFGRIDILVNNAGITADDLILRMSEEEWDSVIDTNLKGTFSVTKAAVRPMVRQRFGRIISVSSVAGLVGNPGQANYAAAKAGMIGFTKSIAKEVASRNITANVIAPGFIDTEMTASLTDAQKEQIAQMIALGRTGTPDDIAPAAVFLASNEAAYVTGHVLTVDGGLVMY
jgi:3-oxoacyl-[acyl-carrier protein] reductase